jgi:hypothetical protein
MITSAAEWLQCRDPRCSAGPKLVPREERNPRCSCGQILKRLYVKPTVTPHGGCDPHSSAARQHGPRGAEADAEYPEATMGPPTRNPRSREK